MATEGQFDFSNVEPAKIDNEEHLDEHTQKPDSNTSDTKLNQDDVHANNQDSERYANLQSAYTKVTQENSELSAKFEELQRQMAQLQAGQSQQAIPQAQFANTPDAMEVIAKDYTQLQPLTSNVRKLQDELEAQKTVIEEQRETMLEGQRKANQSTHEQKIMAVHPDVYEVAKTMEFNGWLVNQPSYMQRLMRDGTAEDVIALFSAFKQSGTTLNEATQAGSPNTKSGGPKLNTNNEQPVFRSSQVSAMNDAEFVKNEAAIDKAILEGRYIQDS